MSKNFKRSTEERLAPQETPEQFTRLTSVCINYMLFRLFCDIIIFTSKLSSNSSILKYNLKQSKHTIMNINFGKGGNVVYYIHTEIYTLRSRRVNFRSQTDVNQTNVAYCFSHLREKRDVQPGAAYHVFSRVSRTAS